MANKSVRRRVNPLSLAFLDVMFCGFGAVILIFLILDHNSTDALVETDYATQAEVDLLEQEILEGEEGLVQIRNTVDDVSLEVVTAEGMALQIQSQLDDFLQQLAALENSGTAEERLQELRDEVEQLEQDLLELQATSPEEGGNSARQFVGDGNRQYLSGMFLGGQRILILLDSSTSMLDNSLINILRTRNMTEQRQKAAPKWQRSVRSVDWVSSQLPITSRYQIIHFAEDFAPVLEETDGQWLEVADRDQLNRAINAVHDLVPNGGTNLERAFRGVANMEQLPDNIFLVTDGLPTLSGDRTTDGLVTPSQRLRLFEDAFRELPEGIPVNVILLPLEGDPNAAAAYWQLAQQTRGSFLTPSSDWP
ncbi:MAG: VWA domain-containing protein [Pseudohongiellaceae bacterium]